MQITITDRNEWESEDFSFILEVTEETLEKIKVGIENESALELEEDTSYDQDEINMINKHSKNCYMDRIGFYEITKDLNTVEDWYVDLFYKGVGLNKLNFNY